MSTSRRLSQIEKLKKSISILKGEIEIITLTCSTYYGPDCNLTTPECDSKCISCGSTGQCTSCSGNWDGPTCSSCKSGWNGTLCNVPVCDSKCSVCSSPGVCSQCIGNWIGTTCSTCKTGWNGPDCSSNLILTSAQITNFTNLILPSAQLIPSKLLFKATRDGFSASAFHSKCDNKGATITIIKATSGAIFGGFTSVSWGQTGSFAQDQTAFIFSLVAPSLQERFVKFTQDNPSLLSPNKYNYSIYLDTNNGPTFGGGFDITISDNSNVNTNSFSLLCVTYCDATMYTSYGYQTDTTKNYLAGSYRFIVEDYEVYAL